MLSFQKELSSVRAAARSSRHGARALPARAERIIVPREYVRRRERASAMRARFERTRIRSKKRDRARVRGAPTMRSASSERNIGVQEVSCPRHAHGGAPSDVARAQGGEFSERTRIFMPDRGN